MAFLFYLLFGIFLGTFWLSFMHYIIHKFKIYNISIYWKYHKLHHQKDDPEQILRKKYNMFEYSVVSSLKYFNILKWSLLDWLVLAYCFINPYFIISYVLGVFIAENIGYLQHTWDGTPVDFTNKFDNIIGLKAGYHADHHGVKSQYSVDTELYFGLLCSYIWFFICTILYPVLLLNPVKANKPGVYRYNMFRNLANFKAVPGNNYRNLLYRMSSIFDKPILLWQYLHVLVGKIPKCSNPKLRHEVSHIRNIYIFDKSRNTDGIVFDKEGKVIEGHHRYCAINNII